MTPRFRFGLIWVVNRRAGTVTVVDPDTNRVQQTLPASGSWPIGQSGPGLAYASDSLWVANTAQGQVTRVEPDADPIPIQLNARAVWVALAA